MKITKHENMFMLQASAVEDIYTISDDYGDSGVPFTVETGGKFIRVTLPKSIHEALIPDHLTTHQAVNAMKVIIEFTTMVRSTVSKKEPQEVSQEKRDDALAYLTGIISEVEEAIQDGDADTAVERLQYIMDMVASTLEGKNIQFDLKRNVYEN